MGVSPAIRLNGTSDIIWEKKFPELFFLFPQVIFYDYTKISKRFSSNWLLPKNYFLIFSRTEDNDPECEKLLKQGHNVAVVFGDMMPDTLGGYEVIK